MVDIWSLFNRFSLNSPCLLCGDPSPVERGLCDACEQSLPRLHTTCSTCGIGLPENTSVAICGHCQHQPPPVDHTIAAFHYQTPVDFLLQSLKFREQLSAARFLAKSLGQRILHSGNALPECVFPVPLHPARLKERGYNQALEIARPLAKQFNLAIDLASCQRVKATHAQSDLSARNRVDNIRGAFEVRSPLSWHHVAIVDDVMTTGNTVWEMARCLKHAGVNRVDVWVCARAF